MKMQWYHEPPAWQQQGSTLSVTAAPNTDFWRKTHDGGVRDNGHFYFCSVTGDFTAQVKITGNYTNQYDQGGLMVRLADAHWLKCGVELAGGQQHASAVVTRDWSDWSLVPLRGAGAIWVRVERHESTFTVHYSLDGQDYTMIRQTFLTETPRVDVGPMVAAPKGGGLTVTFEKLSINAHRD